MREIDKRMREAHQRLAIKPGDIYESCSYHPVLCLGVNYRSDEIWGISLVDGTHPHSCSLLHCGVRKLSVKQAWQIKTAGPMDPAVRDQFKPEARWWGETALSEFKVGHIGPRAERKATS